MRKLALPFMLAAAVVVAPPVLDEIIMGPGATFLIAPLVLGLYIGSVFEQAGLLRMMDESGDVTVPAVVIMYLGSFFVWFVAGVAIKWGLAWRMAGASANKR